MYIIYGYTTNTPYTPNTLKKITIEKKLLKPKEFSSFNKKRKILPFCPPTAYSIGTLVISTDTIRPKKTRKKRLGGVGFELDSFKQLNLFTYFT